jgi:hypothetical protein
VNAATDVDLRVMIAVTSSMDLSANPNGNVGANLGVITDNHTIITLKAAVRPNDIIITEYDNVRLRKPPL